MIVNDETMLDRDFAIAYASSLAWGMAGLPDSPRANPAASSVMMSSFGRNVPEIGTARFSADRRSLATDVELFLRDEAELTE